MKRITTSTRLALCLALMSLSSLMIADLLGLFPDLPGATLKHRIALCESLAVNCSILASRNDVPAIEKNLNSLVRRNPDVMSAGLRYNAGHKLVTVGDHSRHWQVVDGKPDQDNIYVPITAQGRPWGTIEVAFQDLNSIGSGSGWMSMFTEFAAFVIAANALVFIFWLHRALIQLDPNRVMPNRVRAAFDTLAEGLLVLDQKGRIVLANLGFTKTVGVPAEDLQGRDAGSLPWATELEGHTFPWTESLKSNEQRLGIPIKLKTDNETARCFIVNACPIMGDDGKNCGVLASFDDVTELENKKADLLRTLKSLKQSREEISEQNKELKRLATIDPLTECLNRRSFFPDFENYWREGSESNRPLSAFMVDIDHFKSINDTHGHAMGDEVLKGVAKCLRDSVGERGLVCRFGGEEFCVLLPNTDLTDAVALAESIRIALSMIDFKVLKITASLGVSANHLGANGPQEMLEQADKCLYVAKRNGRNQVVCYKLEMAAIEVDETKIRREKPGSEPKATDPKASIPFAAVRSLSAALGYRHAESAEHSARVAQYCTLVAREKMSMADVFVLEVAAELHDIGKIGVPDSILLKPERLTDAEWRVMKANERIGVEIVSAAFDFAPLVDIIRCYKLPFTAVNNGSNLPSGDRIPVGARILAIADAFDSMTSDRTYRARLSWSAAFDELRRCAGEQFDPEWVEHFIEVMKQHGADQHGREEHGEHDSQSLSASIHLANQVAALANAVDEQDLDTLEVLVGRLQATAQAAGDQAVYSLASRIRTNIESHDDVGTLFDLTIELTSLCRSVQQSALLHSQPSANVLRDPVAPIRKSEHGVEKDG